MNNKTNYTLIGFFVLFGFALMIGFSYWLLKPSNQTKNQKYRILFNESVLGLNIDAPVKYRGINVGKVVKLRINPKNTEQVEVIISILKTTPIKETTVAKLTSQGITGLSYINLYLGDNNAPPLKAKKGQKYPTIKTEPSFFERFEKSLGTVSSKLSKTLSGTERLLSNENQEQIAITLKQTALLMQKLNKTLNEKTITHFQNSMKNLDEASIKLNNMMPKIDTFIDKSMKWEDDISASFNSIMNSYLGIKSSMDEIKRAVSSGEFNFKAIAKDITPTLNQTMQELEQTMMKLQNTLEQYQRSPSDIIYKQEEPKKAPGER